MLNLKDVLVTKNMIKPYINETPLYYSAIYSKELGREIYFKLENYQVTGSFKIRGVLSKLSRNIKETRNKTVLTVSTGNHGIAVAYASAILGLKAKIVVPKNITYYKLQRLRALDADIVVYGNDYDEAEKYALELSNEENYLFISPYNDINVISGQGTIALEILAKEPKIDTIIVPVGGGGLISGISFVAKKLSREIRVYGVQSDASPAMYESFKKGHIVKVQLKPSIAEGLHGNIEEGSITFDFVKNYVDGIWLVNEKEIRDAIRDIYYREGIIIEGAAAVTLAALTEKIKEIEGKKICLVLSGGNIDPKHFITSIQRSMNP